MQPQPLARVKAFEELGFGLFVHWGLYSQLGMGEWALKNRQIPKAAYEKLFDTFTAADFDAAALARMAKKAGAKYIVLTTRHHEGFSLYDTAGLNTYDAPHSPAGRDLVREFVEACRQYDVLPFFYHTTLDWWKEEFTTDFEAYLEYLNRSVEVLCTRYGKIGGFWFDGNWSKPDADWKEAALYAMIRRHQPEAIIVNNTGLSHRGALGTAEIDAVTYERGRPTPMNREGMSKYVAAEMCETINNHWGIGCRDLNNKSTAQLIETLCACRKAGANLLLNIGPTAQGGVLPLQQYTLETIGAWVALFDEAIRCAKPCGIYSSGKDFALAAGNKRYFFIHNLNIHGNADVTISYADNKQRVFSGVDGSLCRMRWMDNDEVLSFVQSDDTVTIYTTDYPYGVDLVVRVAVAELVSNGQEA